MTTPNDAGRDFGTSDCSSALSPEEQVSVYRIARNFQHDPQKVVRLIRETVGVDRLQVAVDYLESVVK
jgi:hypothetical protein